MAIILRWEKETPGPVLTLPRKCSIADKVENSHCTMLKTAVSDPRIPFLTLCVQVMLLFMFKRLHVMLYSWLTFWDLMRLLMALLHLLNSLSKFACLLFIQQVSVLYMCPDSYCSRKLLTWAWSSLKTTPPLFSTAPQRRSALFFKWWFSEAAPFDVGFP